MKNLYAERFKQPRKIALKIQKVTFYLILIFMHKPKEGRQIFLKRSLFFQKKFKKDQKFYTLKCLKINNAKRIGYIFLFI